MGCAHAVRAFIPQVKTLIRFGLGACVARASLTKVPGWRRSPRFVCWDAKPVN
jgi:hypothetical protein